MEFNPGQVAGYRLIGYENRLLDTEDFTDDTKDAGEMGAGHQMVALYEIVPAAAGETAVSSTTSRYQDTALIGSDEMAYVAVRYKLPESDTVMETGSALTAPDALGTMSADMAFASAVAEFGLLLLDSEYKADSNLNAVLERAMLSRGEDPFGYRAEFYAVGIPRAASWGLTGRVISLRNKPDDGGYAPPSSDSAAFFWKCASITDGSGINIL